jgi:hypothetical protein
VRSAISRSWIRLSGSLQQFFNDYTRIRNAMTPMKVGGFGGTSVLTGDVKGTVAVGSQWGPDFVTDQPAEEKAAGELFGKWKEWAYFSNTN